MLTIRYTLIGSKISSASTGGQPAGSGSRNSNGQLILNVRNVS